MFGLFGASALYQRSVVAAHDGYWIVCLVLEKSTEEPPDADRFALAVSCDKDGHVTLPSTPQLIRFTPPEVIAKRERQQRCALDDHRIGDRWTMLGGKMVRSCACHERREEREPTPEERQRLSSISARP